MQRQGHLQAFVPAQGAPVRSNIVFLRDHEANCASCGIRHLCLPLGLEADSLHRLEQIISLHLAVRRKTSLYRPGDPFTALYAIRLGMFKTVVVTRDGHEQITGYHMPGDVVGLDGICDSRHACEAIALEDSEVCVLPFNRLDELAVDVPSLRRNLYRLMSKDICGDQDMMLLLGSRCAEERLVLFLLNLADRYQSRGYSPSEFVLRMTREEIASFLGLKLETVSRLFSHLQEEGLIQVQGRAIKLLDTPGLRARIGQQS